MIKGTVYDRIDGEQRNTIEFLLPDINAFLRASRFRTFYRKHNAYYQSLLAGFRDTINTKDMIGWLDKNFPSTSYDCYKVIFSPLVGGNQSSKWLVSPGYREAQAHVNYPFTFFFQEPTGSAQWRRGNILFTEFNHAYINPEAEKYATTIARLFTNKDAWADKTKAAAFYARHLSDLFNEYMNWGLVSLRYWDSAPRKDLPALLEYNTNYMVRRGFLKAPAFNAFLLKLYRDRKPGVPLAALYPEILEWFKQND